MEKVIRAHPALVSTLEKVVDPVFEDDVRILLVDVEAFVANEKEVVATIERGLPVIFYGFDTLEKFVASGMSAASYLHLKNTEYMQLPPRAVEGLAAFYNKIIKNKNVENKALKLLSIVSNKRYLANIFLHDLQPGKKDHETILQKANEDLGVTGTLEQVRKKLEVLRSRELKSKAVAGLAKGEVLPGVFCDIEGTLFVKGEINPAILEKLNEYSKDRAVTLWTGGDVHDLRKRLAYNRIYYPLVSKYDFYDCKVETVIDDLTPEEFFKEYGIVASEYIQVK